MSVTDSLGRISALLKAAAAVIALMPGVATLLGLVDIPPSIATLTKFTSFFVGTACLLTVALSGDRIARVRPLMVACAVIGLALCGAAAATEYYIFAGKHVVIINDTDLNSNIVIVPINPSKEIRDIVSPFQGDYLDALESSPMRFRLMDLLHDESAGAVITLMALLVIAQAFSTTAIVLAAWKAALKS